MKVPNKKMIDVCAGPMTIKDVLREIEFYDYYNKPEHIIIDIKKTKDHYYATIYIDKNSFGKKEK
jgi:hypothetical protein